MVAIANVPQVYAVNPTCTNCGLTIDEVIEIQNLQEEQEIEVSDYCCGSNAADEEKENEVENVNDVEELAPEPKAPTTEELIAALQAMQAQLAELKKVDVKPNAQPSAVKKNQKPSKPTDGRKYVLLNKDLSKWGKVPQQQLDLADLLGKNLKVGQEYTEGEVFDLLVDKSCDYESLYKSKQDPTYLFRYYRGLKNDGKHAGFIARNFVRVIG